MTEIESLPVRLLLSNDDGLFAKGLQTLIRHLAPLHEVYVVAPDQERSAMGHALTLHHPVRIQEHVLDAPVKRAFSTSGTPSDCVKLALSTLLEEEVAIDMVVSGINHGPNLGSDVFYSGTVSAAMEGSFYNKPSVAVSLFNGHEKHAEFDSAARFISEFLPQIAALHVPERTLFNINFPAVPLEAVCGIQVTKLGLRMYDDRYEKRQDPRGATYYWLAGELVIPPPGDAYEDVEAIRNNWISITPLHSDLTDYKLMQQLEASLEGPFKP